MTGSGDSTVGRSDGSVSHAIIEAVAAAEGVDPTDIEPPDYEPLYDVVDPEALDRLFTPSSDGRRRTNGRVQLHYCGYTIEVGSDGQVSIVEHGAE